MTEQEAREAIAKAFDSAGWTRSAADVREGNGARGAHIVVVRALLHLLRTSELERRALETCEQASSACSIRDYERACEAAERIGRESLAAKKPKGPWRVEGHKAIHKSGRSQWFYDEHDSNDPAACAEWVREQNEKAAR